MAYPPSDPAANKTNSTPTPDDHAPHHDALANAVIDIVDELGAGPKGASADLTARLSTLDTTVASKVGTGDSRLTDARTPTGTAGGVLSGTYPNPTFVADMATQAELDAVATTILTPWLVHIDGYLPPYANTNWNSLFTGAVYRSPVAGDPGATTYPYRQSSGAQNAELGYKLLLGAGTWAFDLQSLVSTHSGIITVLLDNSSVGTIDLYHTTLAYSYVQSLTGITVSTTAVHDVVLRMATKNASSDNYYGYIQTAQFRRTA